jgi:prevent-host-death family protein
MAETYPLTQARTRLGELVSRARFGRERVVLTEHGRPVAAIVSLEELDALQQTQDAADIAQAQEVVAAGEPKIPEHQASMLLEVDDSTYAALIAEFRARGAAGIPDEEFAALVRAHSTTRSA